MKLKKGNHYAIAEAENQFMDVGLATIEVAKTDPENCPLILEYIYQGRKADHNNNHLFTCNGNPDSGYWLSDKELKYVVPMTAKLRKLSEKIGEIVLAAQGSTNKR